MKKRNTKRGKNLNDSDDDEMGMGQGNQGNEDSNTIMQQINNFSTTPMNDAIAERTIEDHKYLLELVENRCAIAYFAVANRNQSLFFALQKYYNTFVMKDDEMQNEDDRQSGQSNMLRTTKGGKG